MSAEIIHLKKTDETITHNPRSAFSVDEGDVLVYVVPWSETRDEIAGQRVMLCEVNAGHSIPAFAWKDQSFVSWRFMITPRQESAAMHVIEGGATIPLKKRFLSNAGISTYDIEGFERSLVEFYNEKKLSDDVFIERGVKRGPAIQKEAYEAIRGGVNGQDYVPDRSATDLYNVLSYICLKIKTKIMPFDQMEKTVSDMTVQEMARVSHLICREVTLDENWYKDDCGILIADLEGRPVACLPRSQKGYIIYDVKAGKARRLTEKIARSIDLSAYSIRRSLPRTVLKKKDMVAFVRRGIYPSRIASILIFNAICTLIGVLVPKMNQLVYDKYIPLGNEQVLLEIGAVIASFMIGNVFISLVEKLQKNRVSCSAGYEMQDAMYQRAMDLSESFYRENNSADLAQRLMGFGSMTNQLVSLIVVNGFTLVMSLIYLVQMITYSRPLALVGGLMLLVYSLIIYGFSRLQTRHRREIAENNSEAVGKLYQFLGGVDKIRMAGAEERAILEYTLPASRKVRAGITAGRISALISILTDAGSVLFSVVLYYMMVKGKNQISTGSFLAFNSAFGALTGGIMGFVGAISSFVEMKPQLKRLAPFMSAAPESDGGEDPVIDLTGDVSLEHVTFAYNPVQGNVLNDLSLHIKKGEYVAIVGPSGCGKSTILKLLMGFESPNEGKICYDNKDLASLDKNMLRRKIGVVLQNGKLIAGSIYENIKITSQKATMEDVMQVIADVGLKEDIEAMPMGIHTVLSESGNTISGGQQQRILIARAICNAPPILYFDEATSALDNQTQAIVCKSLEQRNMTRVVIAHRLSTVMHCDRIIVIDGGRISEEGTYEQLMAKGGLFYQMAIRQLVQ